MKLTFIESTLFCFSIVIFMIFIGFSIVVRTMLNNDQLTELEIILGVYVIFIGLWSIRIVTKL